MSTKFDLRPRRPNFPLEFKLKVVELSHQPGGSVAQVAREYGINDNLLFKWRQRWREGALCPPGQTLLPQPAALLPIEVIPEPASSEETHSLPPAIPSLASAASYRVEFRHGNMTLENPSPALLYVLIRELTGRAR